MSETDTGSKKTVQEMFLDGIARHGIFRTHMTTERLFRDGIDARYSRTLSVLGLGHGVATGGSSMDGYLHGSPHVGSIPPVTSVFEVNNDCLAPKEGNLEAIANATNVAMGMVARGVKSSEVVVPIFSCNGRLVQVLAVYSLPETTFPVVCFLTTVYLTCLIRLAWPWLLQRALDKMILHCKSVDVLCSAAKPLQETPPMSLDTDRYHIKKINDFFSSCGDGMVDESVSRFFTLTSELSDANFACCPLAYRLGDPNSSLTQDVIVFENLSDYRIGLPKESCAERQKLVAAIREAAQKLHDLGLVHMDLYLSNIMWTKDTSGAYSTMSASLILMGFIESERNFRRRRRLA